MLPGVVFGQLGRSGRNPVPDRRVARGDADHEAAAVDKRESAVDRVEHVDGQRIGLLEKAVAPVLFLGKLPDDAVFGCCRAL
jgi:hypothetical protein